MSILARLRQTKPETADDIDRARKEVQAALKAEQDAIDALEKRRDDLVLDGSEDEIVAADAEIAASERRLRDLDIARVRLAQRHEAAIQQEQRSELERSAKAVAESMRLNPALIGEAARSVQAFLSAMAKMEAAERERNAHNERCQSAKAGDLVVSAGFEATLAAIGTPDAAEAVRHLSEMSNFCRRAQVYVDAAANAGRGKSGR